MPTISQKQYLEQKLKTMQKNNPNEKDHVLDTTQDNPGKVEASGATRAKQCKHEAVHSQAKVMK
eukprot:4298115-Amphidinium_carterae.1